MFLMEKAKKLIERAHPFSTHHVQEKILEDLLRNISSKPMEIPFAVLEHITENFSHLNEIGTGGFGTVYKGELRNGMVVAVKRFHSCHVTDDSMFRGEDDCLMRVKHKNIVRCLGRCSHSYKKGKNSNGQRIIRRELLFCFEYMEHESLDKFIKGEAFELDWPSRYKIIKGICDGLNYLHNTMIIHLDLKPANILLDTNMVPKISDFGISRIFGEEQTRIVTKHNAGTSKYMPHEYKTDGCITKKADVYSFGIIIRDLLFPGFCTSDARAIDYWRARLLCTTPDNYEKHLDEVKGCFDIAEKCLKREMSERPSASKIMQMLNEIDCANCCDVDLSHDGQVSEGGAFLDMPSNNGGTLFLHDVMGVNEGFKLDTITEEMQNNLAGAHLDDKMQVPSNALAISRSSSSSLKVDLRDDHVFQRIEGKEPANDGLKPYIECGQEEVASSAETNSLPASTTHSEDGPAPEICESLNQDQEQVSESGASPGMTSNEQNFFVHSITNLNGAFKSDTITEDTQKTWAAVPLDDRVKVLSDALALPCPLSSSEQGELRCDEDMFWNIERRESIINSGQEDVALSSEICSRPEQQEFLGISQTKICFPLNPVLDVSCSIVLTNNTNKHVIFDIKAEIESGYKYIVRPTRDVVPPWSKFTVFVTRKTAESRTPLNATTEDKFVVGSLQMEEPSAIKDNMFTQSDNRICELTVIAVHVLPEETTFEGKLLLDMVTSRSVSVSSVDLHASEPLIMVGGPNGQVEMWDYNLKELMKFNVNSYIHPSLCRYRHEVYSVKFIERDHLIVATCGGSIIICKYYTSTISNVKTINAHPNAIITSLAVHPKEPYLLSSSDDSTIKLWNWEKANWELNQPNTPIRTFRGHSATVMQIAFNPTDINSFASASRDHTLKIWNMDHDAAKLTLSGHSDELHSVDFFTGRHPYLITGSRDKSARVWDYKEERCVQILNPNGHLISTQAWVGRQLRPIKKFVTKGPAVTTVYFHSNLGMIMTGSKDGSVRIWNSTSFRLDNTFNCGFSDINFIGFLQSSNRIVIGCGKGIVLVDYGSMESAANMNY